MTAAARPISRDDLESKMRELQGEVTDVQARASAYALAAGAVVVVTAVGVAYLLGKRRGRKRSTVVEVRRL